MLKGAQKRMIVIRTRGSRLFEEAYFVMRRDLPDADTRRSDMLWEANRIIDRSLGVSLPHEAAEPDPSSHKNKNALRGLWLFLGGALTGGLTTYLLLLLQ